MRFQMADDGDIGTQRQAAEDGRQRASDAMNEIMMSDYGLTDSERSFFDRKTETWEISFRIPLKIGRDGFMFLLCLNFQIFFY